MYQASMHLRVAGSVAISVVAAVSSAHAQQAPPGSESSPAASAETASVTAAPASPATPVPPGKQFPAIGGHLGFALPIATVGGSNSVIGADFVTAGITPGVTVHLDDKWAIDFEFIAFNELKKSGSTTTFVVDPGILRKFDGFIAGVRIATQVGAPTNGGIVPIFVLPVKISDRLAYFFELDVPLFLRDNGSKPEATATFLFQSGFGF